MISPKEIVVRKGFVQGTYDLRYKHCSVNMGVGEDKKKGKWATVYLIETEPEYRGQGEATAFLERLKYDFGSKGYRFALWCPMSPPIECICEKLDIAIV